MTSSPTCRCEPPPHSSVPARNGIGTPCCWRRRNSTIDEGRAGAQVSCTPAGHGRETRFEGEPRMNRREILRTGFAALSTAGLSTRLLAADSSGPRLLLVFLRGGYDCANLL